MKFFTKIKYYGVDGRPGVFKGTHYTIGLKEGTLRICQTLYCTWQRFREVHYEHIKKQWEACVVDSAQSGWASFIVLVPKNFDTLRFSVDNRRPNAATTQELSRCHI